MVALVFAALPAGLAWADPCTHSTDDGSGTLGVQCGTSASATGSAFAIGINATASHANSIALGTKAETTADWTIALGKDDDGNTKYRITNMADGTAANDAVNKKQLDDGLKAKADAADLVNKADTDLGNITNTGKGVITGLIKVEGTGAAEVSSTDNNGKKTWTVHVDGNGKVEPGNTGLVTGGKMYEELRPATGNYVQSDKTTAVNLEVLDTQVKTNADNIAQGLNFSGDTGSVNSQLGTTLAIVSGSTNLSTAAATTSDPNVHQITINMRDDPTFSGTVTAGAVNTGAINADAVTVGTGANPVRIDGTTNTITGLANTAPVTRTNYTPGRAATEDQLAQHHFNISDGTNTSGVYGGDTVRFRGDRNIHVTVDGLDINITLDPDLNVRSVTTGRARMDDSGFHIANGPSVTVNGIDAAGTRVMNVADGVLPGDAVNRRQLDAVDQRLSNRIGRVEDKSYAGISSALAAAALPRSGVPGDLTLGAGVSSYEGASALAVGGAYTTPGGIIFTLAGTVNSEEASASAGVGFRFNLGN